MKVVVSGATGPCWFRAGTVLTKQGHDVFRVTRSKPREAHDIAWDPARRHCQGRIEGAEVFVHLEGKYC